jgi:hypothetical protein
MAILQMYLTLYRSRSTKRGKKKQSIWTRQKRFGHEKLGIEVWRVVLGANKRKVFALQNGKKKKKKKKKPLIINVYSPTKIIINAIVHLL